MGRKKNDKTGETFVSNEGYTYVIVEYSGTNDVVIEIQDQHKTRIHTTYTRCKSNQIKNPYHASKYNVGYIGIGKHKPSINGENTKCYNCWSAMLKRCYDEKFKTKHPTYNDCVVIEEWHNFQNFADWYEKNYYEVEGCKMNLDKDILNKGNKIYSPINCIFVPEKINSLFTKSNNIRGNLPIGVTYDKKYDKYLAQCQCGIQNKKHKFIGYYDNPIQAFINYKKFKENYIKQVADEYKDKIPEKLYNALYDYKVEIDD